jgi:hypothetical protein
MGSGNVKLYILSNAGARNGISGLDALDAEYVNDATNDTGGSYASNEAGTSGLPNLGSETRPGNYDTDNDGLSDAYENANGGSIAPATRPATATLTDGTIIDQTAVTAGIRYTHMDIFLAELAGDWGEGSTPGPTPVVSNLKKKKNIPVQ